MREKIESCRGQISYLLKKETNLSGLERNVLKKCDYELQCIYQYAGEQGKEDSYLFAVANANKILRSTIGITNPKAKDLVKYIKDVMVIVNRSINENASPRGEKRDRTTQDTTPSKLPRAKKHHSFRAPSLFGSTQKNQDSTDVKPIITLGQHRKK